MTGRVVIVGGGVIGLFAAYYCAARGWRVTVVERNGEQRDGCSFGNTGMIVPSHFVPLAAPGMVALALRWMWNPASPFYVKPRASWELIDWGLKFWRAANGEHVQRGGRLLRDLIMASRDCYPELVSQADDFEFTQRGLLALCKTQHALEEEAKAAELARELGLAVEVLDPKQTAARDPGIRMDVAGSVYFSQDSNLAPERLMRSMQRRLAEAGVELAWNTEVTSWHTEHRKIRAAITSVGAELEADEFLLCAGSWSQALAKRLDLRLPLQPGKGYSLTLPRPRNAPRMCALLTEARVAVSPMSGALRFGGTMELAGLNEDINPIRVQGIAAAAQRYYPDLTPADFEGIRPWRGLRPCSPDGLPYLGRPQRYSNLIVATGHAMLGITLGPITGRLSAQILSGERPGVDITLLSPDRHS
ncbi:MAG TPA: FAD-dependent oxidoreductase [Burkholderiales bacterium]|nr:FAD-dependent oxidoreductase [Burkholderiales bacterium]